MSFKCFEEPLTVKEVIELLRKLPQDATVWSYSEDASCWINHLTIGMLSCDKVVITGNPFSNEETFYDQNCGQDSDLIPEIDFGKKLSEEEVNLLVNNAIDLSKDSDIDFDYVVLCTGETISLV